MTKAKKPPNEQMVVGAVSFPIPTNTVRIPARAVKKVTRRASEPSGVSGIYAWLKYPLPIISMIIRSETLLAANPPTAIQLRHFGTE